jgi:hypothetical protein
MAIENTRNRPHPEWLFGANPDAIERQEAVGQAQLATSSQLPVDGLTQERADLYGIELRGPSKGDELFVDVVLPEGWAIIPTSHAMWSDLVDAGGVKRAGIFYKAAFYDRKAHMHWEDA